MNIIITLLILGIIIMVHELGHFLTAKYFKMPVEEFSLGMGPILFSHEGENTKYSIRAIPVGGFVNIQGMEVDSVVKDGFNTKTPFQRFVVLVAGVVMNFLLAYIIIFGSLIYSGKAIQNDNPVIGNVIESSKSFGDLMAGDEILEIDGHQIEKWEDISRVNDEIDSTSMKFLLKRNGKEIEKNIELTYDEGRKDYYIGILPEYTIEKYGFLDAVSESWKAYKNLFKMILTGFKQLITGEVSAKEISGPVGMVKIVGDASQGGMGILFWLTALLSINIGFFNLLPFPALDGGRIIFVILEVLGVKINKKFEERFHQVGMIILFGLIILITFNDILNIFIK
ncbi:MAG: RIP metalloprotease RseP [Fusobacteria bacterium]|nr:MAG: RIP metalloprotease RseP [Fusobacteriota bacterium]